MIPSGNLGWDDAVGVGLGFWDGRARVLPAPAYLSLPLPSLCSSFFILIMDESGFTRDPAHVGTA